MAYRCKDAKETVDFYTKNLNMKFMLAISEDRVPSTKEPDPYMHLFLDAGKGNVLAAVVLAARSGSIGTDTDMSSDNDTLISVLAENVETVFERSGGKVGMDD